MCCDLPEPLYAMLPYPVHYEPYSWAHVLAQTQLLLFSGLAFFVMLPYLKRTLTITLDSDWVWRRLLPDLVRGGEALWGPLREGAVRMARQMAHGAWVAVERRAGARTRLARTWPTGSMALWVLVLLLGYLLLYYI